MANHKKTASFRCDSELFERFVEASKNHSLSLSEWMRRALEETVNLQLPAEVLAGWKQANLEDGKLGAFFAGRASNLPENLINATVEAVTEQGDTWTGIVEEVRFRTERIVVVAIKRRSELRQQPAVELHSPRPPGAKRNRFGALNDQEDYLNWRGIRRSALHPSNHDFDEQACGNSHQQQELAPPCAPQIDLVLSAIIGEYDGRNAIACFCELATFNLVRPIGYDIL